MATKKPETVKPEVEAAPAAEIPQPDIQPERPAEALRGYLPLSADETRRVNLAKYHFEEAINYIKALRDSQHDAEVQRAFAVAITHAETASMWAVKAITWRG